MQQPKIQTPATLLTQSQPLIDNANNLTAQAEKAVVSNAKEFATATDFVRICQGQLAQAEDARDSLVRPLNQHVKWINDQFRPITNALEAAKKKVSMKAATWKSAEDARVRKEEAEQRRLAEEQAIRDAEAAQEAGDEARAEAILSVAADTPIGPVKAQAARGTLTGAIGSTRTNWKGEVELDDITSVCKAIAEGKLPSNMIKDWNKTVMNALAKQVGEKWPEDQNEGKHHGMTVKRDVGLSVR
jgi:hypothetical protein